MNEFKSLVGQILRAGTSDNDINALYYAETDRYRAGFTDPRIQALAGMQNAYRRPKPFPRSEQELDAIMIRRVNARLQLQQNKIIRHWKHVAVVSAAVIFAPLVIAAVLRMWGFALAWIAS